MEQVAETQFVELIIHFDSLGSIIFKQCEQLFCKFKRCGAVGSHDIIVAYGLRVDVSCSICVIVTTPDFQLFQTVAGMVNRIEEYISFQTHAVAYLKY